MGTWNEMVYINDIAKKEEVPDVFRRGKLELLALIETKMERIGVASWCRVNGIYAGIQDNKRYREDVAVLLNDLC